MFDLANEFEGLLKNNNTNDNGLINIWPEIKSLSNQDLDLKLKNLVSRERKITEEILWHIAEVDLRKLYLKMGYSSLYSYLTVHIGYANEVASN